MGLYRHDVSNELTSVLVGALIANSARSRREGKNRRDGATVSV